MNACVCARTCVYIYIYIYNYIYICSCSSDLYCAYICAYVILMLIPDRWTCIYIQHHTQRIARVRVTGIYWYGHVGSSATCDNMYTALDGRCNHSSITWWRGVQCSASITMITVMDGHASTCILVCIMLAEVNARWTYMRFEIYVFTGRRRCHLYVGGRGNMCTVYTYIHMCTHIWFIWSAGQCMQILTHLGGYRHRCRVPARAAPCIGVVPHHDRIPVHYSLI